MSLLDEYTLLSLVIGGMLLLGVSLAILIFHTLNLYVKKSRTFEALQVIGGFIMAIGLISIRVIRGALFPSITVLFIAFFTLIGALLIVLPFFVFRYTKIDRELKVQVFVILASSVTYLLLPLPTLGKIVVILLLFSTIFIILLLMKSVSSLGACTRFNRNLLRVASWFLVLHAWLRYYSFKNPQTCIHYEVLLIYFISLLIWVYSTLKTYETLREWF